MDAQRLLFVLANVSILCNSVLIDFSIFLEILDDLPLMDIVLLALKEAG
jgi:hypothetical protein